MENYLDMKLFREEMNMLIDLDHDYNKRALNLIIASVKEYKDDDTITIVKEELKNKSPIETSYLIESRR